MDRDRLSRSKLYEMNQSSFDKIMHLSGVPRDFFDVSRDEVVFAEYKAKRPWSEPPDQHAVLQTVTEQVARYDLLLRSMLKKKERPENEFGWPNYMGLVTVITSKVVDFMACRAAAHLARNLREKREHEIFKWVDATQRTKRGYAIGAPWDDEGTPPSLTIVTGLHIDPTKELRESVRRWWEYGRRFGHVVLVGYGGDPIETSAVYGIVPDNLFLAGGIDPNVKSIKTAG